MDPRMSERRRAVTREQGRRRLRIMIVSLAGSALLIGVWLLLHTPVFGARSITVTGDVHERAAQVVAQAGLEHQPPLVDVNGGVAAARLERLPWVRAATVQVSWPDGVDIAITEEVPWLAAREPGGRWASVSADGRVLQVTTTRPTGLRLLRAPVPPGRAGTRLGRRDRIGLLVAATLPRSFAAQVTGVTVEPAGWVQLTMKSPIVVDVGTATQLTAKYEDVSSILAGATLHRGDVIDVSVPQAPTVTPG